jgi:hypothetical protein
MSKFCLAEIATLLIGWISNCLFLLYSEGVFTGDHEWSLMDLAFLNCAAIMAFPYALTFVCCWLLRRFVRAFLLLSLFLTIGSTCAYYGVYVAGPPADAGWVFLVVPFTQTAIVAAFSFLAFIGGLIFKSKQAAPEPAS